MQSTVLDIVGNAEMNVAARDSHSNDNLFLHK